MTEKEAFKKLCPVDKSACIGTKCMAWRWDLVPNPAFSPFGLMQQHPPVPQYIQAEEDGHCGMANG